MSAHTFGSAVAALSLAGLAVLGTASTASAQTDECYPNCPRTISDSTPRAGQTITVSTGQGSFAAGESVDYAIVRGESVNVLGTAIADANGDVTVTFVVPSDTPPGKASVLFSGESGTTVVIPFTVVAAGGGGGGGDDDDDDGSGSTSRGGSLPRTGANDVVAITAVGASFLVAGAGLVLVARRRRESEFTPS